MNRLFFSMLVLLCFLLQQNGFAQSMMQFWTAEDYRRMKPGPEKEAWFRKVEGDGWFFTAPSYKNLNGKPIEAPPVDLSPFVDESGESVFLITEKDPEFPGGQASFEDYLQNAVGDLLVKPDESVQNSVRIKFTIEKDGRITDVAVLDKNLVWVDQKILERCLQTIQDMPNWSPGAYRGRAVKMKLAFTFSLGA